MPPKRRQPLKKPKATVDRLANENTPANSTPKAGQEAIDRVRKCFERANHPNANEQEAKAASRMASRIMERYQISQVDLMLNEANSQREKRGGISTVDIRPAGGRAFISGWVEWLRGAIETFFDCRSFTTYMMSGYLDHRIRWTFYGIAEHTVSAAIAFEAIHNQIQDWSEEYVGIPQRNSYCLGVADGLLTLSKVEKKAAEARARESEEKAFATKIREEDEKERERHLALDFNIVLGSESENEMDIDHVSETSDDDVDAVAGAVDDGGMDKGAIDNEALDDGDGLDDTEDNEVLPDFTERDEHETLVDTTADFEAELRRFVPPEHTREHHDEPLPRPPAKPTPTIQSGNVEAEAEEETVAWQSMRQLSLYREMSQDIGKKVLEEMGIKKLRMGRKRENDIKDSDAFKQGRKDSKEIRLRAARIEKGSELQKEPTAHERSNPDGKARAEKRWRYQADVMDVDE